MDIGASEEIMFKQSGDEMTEKIGDEDVLSSPIDVTDAKDGGVLKEIIKAGSGWETPAAGDKVFVHYVGKLEDGTVFDSSRDRGSTFSFTLGQGQVIKGWDLAVASMKAGELCQVTIRSEYGYGATGSPPKIPPNATLIFEIELFDWKMVDCTKKTDGGVRKRTIVQGSGYSTPNDGATIQAHIVGKFNNKVFDERDITFCHGEASESNIVEGLDLGIGKMKSGEKALIYIRSDYAWGPNPPAEFNLPADYNEVIYEVTLNSFEKEKETWEMSEEERLEHAKLAKDKGSNYFKQNKFQLSLKQYKKIPTLIGPYRKDGLKDDMEEEDMEEEKSDVKVDEKEKNSVLLAGHLNLAMVYLKLEQYHDVLKNCDSALEIDPNNCKGLFRRGSAFSAIQEYEKAIEDFEKLLQLEPENKAAKNQLIKARHGLKTQKEKEKAMFKTMISKYLATSSEESKAPSYDGPIDEVQFTPDQILDAQHTVQEVN